MPTLKVACGLRCQLLTCPFSLGVIPDYTDQSRWPFRAYEALSSHTGRLRHRDGDKGAEHQLFVTCPGADTTCAHDISAPEASADEETVVRTGLLVAWVCAQLFPHRPCDLRVDSGCVGPRASRGEECLLCRDYLG